MVVVISFEDASALVPLWIHCVAVRLIFRARQTHTDPCELFSGLTLGKASGNLLQAGQNTMFEYAWRCLWDLVLPQTQKTLFEYICERCSKI